MLFYVMRRQPTSVIFDIGKVLIEWDPRALFEKLIDDDAYVIACKCGGLAKRTISAPRYFGNSTGKSPAGRYKPC